MKEESKVKLSLTKPEKTATAYKLFYLHDGKLYPPMVQNPDGSATPVGKWIDASAAEISAETKTGRPQIQSGGKGTHSSKGYLAYRPGWHLGEVPIANQFNKLNPETGKKELLPKDFVWAVCEYSCDKDYQQEAMKNGYTEKGKYRRSYAGLQKLPENGFYRYRTNPNPETEEWIITGKIKVIRLLSGREVDELVKKAGKTPQKREKGSYMDLEEDLVKNLSRSIPVDRVIERQRLQIKRDAKEMEKRVKEELDKLVKKNKENCSRLCHFLKLRFPEEGNKTSTEIMCTHYNNTVFDTFARERNYVRENPYFER